MRILDAITADPRQKMSLLTETGERVIFELFYLPSQQAWFCNLSYGTVTARGLQLVNGPNILRNYRNRLPFGLACLSADNVDPRYLTDFETGRSTLYLLSGADVDAIETAMAS